MSSRIKKTYAKLDDANRKIRTTKSAKDYKELPLDVQIYKKPGTYIGSIHPNPRTDDVFNPELNKFTKEEIDLCDGIIRIVLEILGNAADNIYHSLIAGVKTGSIDMKIDNKRITIRSGGDPIFFHVKQNLSTPETCVTIIERIFGILLTSSNYDDDIIRTGGGTNGYGSKLANIFAELFGVKIGDNIRGFEHEAVWINNMSEIIKSESTPKMIYDPDTPCRVILHEEKRDDEDNIIEEEESVTMPGTWIKGPGESYKGEPYVEITIDLDLKRFGLTEITQQMQMYFYKMLIDTGISTKVPVSFNGKVHEILDVKKDYAPLIFAQEEIETCICHYEWGTEGNKLPKKFKKDNLEEIIAHPFNKECVPVVELYFFDTPNNARHYSCVNGLMTLGGVHVDGAFDVFFHKIVDFFNNGGVFSKPSKKKTDKSKPEKPKPKEKEIKLTIRDVKPHVSMIMICRLEDTDYTSQSKTILTRPTPSFNVTDESLKPVEKWKLNDILNNLLMAKNMKIIDGPTTSGRAIVKGVVNANDAGGKHSASCVLYIAEGKSGSGYSSTRILHSEGTQDRNGYFSMKGKPPNCSKHDEIKIFRNAEYNAIMRAVGLEKNKDYTIPENRENLKYGLIIINTDADEDAYHITGLLINFFYTYFPTLFQIGMIGFLMTPAIKLFKNNKICKRFQTHEYKIYKEENPNCKLDVRYYKGLGTSNEEDIKDDLETAKQVVFVIDDLAKENLDMSFNTKLADKRKESIKELRGAFRKDDFIDIRLSDLLSTKDTGFLNNNNTNPLIVGRTITNFLRTDLIEYSIGCFFRAIPSYKDTLKRSQRQVLYYMLENWNYGNSNKKDSKVESIASTAANDLNYHHGAVSLEQTLIKMSETYTGSNNLNVTCHNGRYGTREYCKTTTSSRYLLSNLEWWVKYVYFKEIIDMVPKRIEEGEAVDPIWIAAIIPLGYINGFRGLGRGTSTFSPSYKPTDIIRWIINKAKGKKTDKLIPFFDGFKGKVKIVNIVSKDEVNKKNENPDIEQIVVDEEETPDEPVPDEEDIPDEEDDDKKFDIMHKKMKGISVRTEGIYEITKQSKGLYNITITELPIGVSLIEYKEWCESLILNKRLKDVTSISPDNNSPLFYLTGYNPTPVGKKLSKEPKISKKPEENKEPKEKEKKNHKIGHEAMLNNLKLVKSFSLCNMNLIDDDGFPMYFKNIEEGMEMYYSSMIELLAKVVGKKIKDTEEAIIKLNKSKILIELINSEKIVVVNKNKKEIIDQMKKYDIEEEHMKGKQIWDLTPEEMQVLIKKIEERKIELENLKKVTPEKFWIEKLLVLEKQLNKRGCVTRDKGKNVK